VLSYNPINSEDFIAQWGRAVCAERCKYGSEGGSRKDL